MSAIPEIDKELKRLRIDNENMSTRLDMLELQAAELVKELRGLKE